MWPLLEDEELGNPVSLSGTTWWIFSSRILAAFVVRFLTRRFIGDYSSNICSAYPHTVTLDNSQVAVIVWDTPALNTQVRPQVLLLSYISGILGEHLLMVDFVEDYK